MANIETLALLKFIISGAVVILLAHKYAVFLPNLRYLFDFLGRFIEKIAKRFYIPLLIGVIVSGGLILEFVFEIPPIPLAWKGVVFFAGILERSIWRIGLKHIVIITISFLIFAAWRRKIRDLHSRILLKARLGIWLLKTKWGELSWWKKIWISFFTVTCLGLALTIILLTLGKGYGVAAISAIPIPPSIARIFTEIFGKYVFGFFERTATRLGLVALFDKIDALIPSIPLRKIGERTLRYGARRAIKTRMRAYGRVKRINRRMCARIRYESRHLREKLTWIKVKNFL